MVAVALRQLLFSCNARARMADRLLVGLLYRDPRGAGRAVRMCMRFAARDNTTTIIITITTTIMVLTSVPTYRALEKMRTETCLVLRRRHAVATVSRALLSRELLGASQMMTTPWYGCECGRENGAMREALALIRGWTQTQTRMRMMVILGCGPGVPTIE